MLRLQERTHGWLAVLALISFALVASIGLVHQHEHSAVQAPEDCGVCATIRAPRLASAIVERVEPVRFATFATDTWVELELQPTRCFVRSPRGPPAV